VELTGAGSETVGCFGAPLHSKTLPGELAAKAGSYDVALTFCVLTRPLFGFTAKVGVCFLGAVVEGVVFGELLEQAPSVAPTSRGHRCPILALRVGFPVGSRRRHRPLFSAGQVAQGIGHLRYRARPNDEASGHWQMRASQTRREGHRQGSPRRWRP